MTAVKSCQKLLTADKNEDQPRKLKFGMHINFSVYMRILVIFFISAVISCQLCQQLITIDENENQSKELSTTENSK